MDSLGLQREPRSSDAPYLPRHRRLVARGSEGEPIVSDGEENTSMTSARIHAYVPNASVPNGSANGSGRGASEATKKRRPGKSRAEIEAEAKSMGALGG